MTLLKKILCSNRFIFLFFILLHVVLFNINSVEWGDSYRILRSAEFIKQGSYPSDEKRPPLFSVILALHPSSIDAVTFGRSVLLLISIFNYLLFSKLINFYIKEDKYKKLALLLFALNPTYLYWSLRIMADVAFSFFVLLVFVLLAHWKGAAEEFGQKTEVKTWQYGLLGFIVGLSVLTRFEGYLLLASVLVVLFFTNRKLQIHKGNLTFVLLFTLTVGPYILTQNPFGSSYLDEPSGRTYDLNTLWIYIVSTLCIFGLPTAYFFTHKSLRLLYNFLIQNFHIATFLFLEMALILVWPAAIPRLFVAVIPILIILFVLSVKNVFEHAESTISLKNKLELWGMQLFLIGFYVVSQYVLKLQFLIVFKMMFVVVVVLSLVLVSASYIRSYSLFVVTTGVLMFLWSGATIWLHKDLHTSIKQGALYIAQKYPNTKVAHNDVNSVADWYLNYAEGPRNEGVYVKLDSSSNMSQNDLKGDNIDYLLYTNEHNPTLELDLENKPYLEEVTEFSYNIGSTKFFTKVIKVL